MSSNSASALATQQSIKAYVDSKTSSTQGVKKGFTTNPSTYTRVALVKTDGSLTYKNDISSTELGYLNNVSSNIQTQLTNINTQLSSKASSSHNHDSTYLRKSGGTITGNLKIGSPSTTYAPLHVETMRTQRISGGSNGGENRYNHFHWNTALKHKREAFNYLISIYAKGSILTERDIVAISDKRTKKDIMPIKSSLETIKKLRPVHYKKVDEYSFGSKRNYGFIAQEVEKVLPEAVNTSKGEVPILKPFDKVEFEDGVTYTILVKNADEVKEQKYTTKDERPDGEIIVKSKEVDDLKSVTYDMVFTVAVDAIQEQQEEIESLKSQLDAIKKALKASGIAIK